jgi:2-octaprenylphenol hydroxylase
MAFMNAYTSLSSTGSAQKISSDICIVGNGAVGKAAALGLAKAGWKVTLLAPVGQSAGTRPVTADWDVRVYALNHVAHDLLAGLKVWDAMNPERIAPVEAMVVSGDTNAQIAFDAYAARQDALAWIVEDKNINAGLDAALRFAGNIQVVYGNATRLVQTEQQASLYLDQGNVIEASLIIGADGGNSWVRGQCDIGLDYRSYGQRGVVSNFACEKPHQGVAHQWFAAEDGIVALLPLPGNQVSLVWSAPHALADVLMREDVTQLAARLAQFAQEKLGTLTPLVPHAVKDFPLRLIKPHAMIHDRVALIGDAAHVVHPLAGHGMNLGFGDVVALLSVLGEKQAQADCGDARLLRRYARLRKEDVLLMQVTTDGLARLFGTTAEPIRWLRNAGLNLVNQFPVLKNHLITQALGKRS